MFAYVDVSAFFLDVFQLCEQVQIIFLDLTIPFYSTIAHKEWCKYTEKLVFDGGA